MGEVCEQKQRSLQGTEVTAERQMTTNFVLSVSPTNDITSVIIDIWEQWKPFSAWNKQG